MIVNAYAVLDAFLTLLRLVLGVLVVGGGLGIGRAWRTADPERRERLEDRSYLLFLLAGVLVVLDVASWPLFYLLLQSYVPEWPGVMCVYGVTRIGVGSVGPSRFLPDLVTALQVLKPLLVFLAGAWAVLYALNRRTRTAPLMPQVLAAVLLLDLVGLADAAAEGAYLLIPKKEIFPAAGCCAAIFGDRGRPSGVLAEALLGADYRPRLFGLYYAANAATCWALLAFLAVPRWRRSAWRLVPLALGALAALAVTIVFVIEVAAPTLLHLPHHHCPYDLIPAAPKSLLALALYVLGCFGTGWACVAGWFGRTAETGPFLADRIGRLLRLALFGYAASVAMLSIELVLA